MQIKTYARGKICFKCDYCGNPQTEFTSKFSRRKRYNCSNKECIKMAKAHVGELNYMYGKTHTDEVKEILRKKAKENFSGKSYEELYGEEKSQNLKLTRSKTFSNYYANNPDHINAFKGKKHSIQSLAKIKNAMVEGSHWRSNDQINDWEIYNKQANWKAPMWDLVEATCFNKFKQFGVFSSRKNPGGIVRDHKYSRWSGFNEGVFPEILRHPVNCQVLSNSDNAKKRSKNSISLSELFEKIKNFTGIWDEHYLVLNLIKQYENGSRWIRRLEV